MAEIVDAGQQMEEIIRRRLDRKDTGRDRHGKEDRRAKTKKSTPKSFGDPPYLSTFHL